MTVLFGTDILRRLRWRGQLLSRLDWLGMLRKPLEEWLLELNRIGSLPPPSGVSTLELQKLTRWGLVASEAQAGRCSETLSLPFVTAVNLELTYDCHLRCRHCLQQNLRERLTGTWLPTAMATRAVTEAWFAGILTAGLNFTGGEIFAAESNLPELLSPAKELGLPFRVNTSGWWGDKTDIRVGSLVFASSRHAIEWLKEMGMAILAVSVDQRYCQYPELWKALVSLVRECERVGQDYQVVLTGAASGSTDEVWNRIAQQASVVPRHMVIAPMEEIDIGGAANSSNTRLDPVSLVSALRHSACRGRGFTRPSLLHIGPDGGVRTCLYAPGSGSLGNITRESLLSIINRFTTNPVVRHFRQQDVDQSIRGYFTLLAAMYRIPDHPCAVSALLVRLVEEAETAREREGGEPSPEAMRRICSYLAQDFNLRRQQEVWPHDEHRSSR